MQYGCACCVVQVNQLTKAKQTASKQLDEARQNYEEENRQRLKLQGEVRNLQTDCDQLRDQVEEEQEGETHTHTRTHTHAHTHTPQSHAK